MNVLLLQKIISDMNRYKSEPVIFSWVARLGDVLDRLLRDVAGGGFNISAARREEIAAVMEEQEQLVSLSKATVAQRSFLPSLSEGSAPLRLGENAAAGPSRLGPLSSSSRKRVLTLGDESEEVDWYESSPSPPKRSRKTPTSRRYSSKSHKGKGKRKDS